MTICLCSNLTTQCPIHGTTAKHDIDIERRGNIIDSIENYTGSLKSIPYYLVSTEDLEKILNALGGTVCKATVLYGQGKLTREVTKEECHWLDNSLPKGKTVYRYPKHDYGVLGENGVAITLKPNILPFFEIPRDSVTFY